MPFPSIPALPRITTCYPEFTAVSAMSKRVKRRSTPLPNSTRRTTNWRRCVAACRRAAAHLIREESVSSLFSRALGLSGVLRILGWVAATLSTSFLAIAQTAPDVQFVDITSQSHVDFTQENSATSSKYLIETMGGGAALFDYDNDGRLDIFLTNGALLADPMPDGAKPDKSDKKYWNRLYHQNADGTFTDVTQRAGLTGMPQGYYSMGVAVGDYDN